MSSKRALIAVAVLMMAVGPIGCGSGGKKVTVGGGEDQTVPNTGTGSTGGSGGTITPPPGGSSTGGTTTGGSTTGGTGTGGGGSTTGGTTTGGSGTSGTTTGGTTTGGTTTGGTTTGGTTTGGGGGDPCGNGSLEIGEACDDGNTVNGDGCSSTCTVEVVTPVCGNGSLEVGEACDDGNTVDGDGCSATCAVEGGGSSGGGSSIQVSSNLLSFAATPLKKNPYVVSTDPQHNAAGVSLGKTLTVTFSKAMDASTVISAFTLQRFAVLFPVDVKSEGTYAYNSGTKALTWTPKDSAAGSKKMIPGCYALTIKTTAKDTEGNPLDKEYKINFRTEGVAENCITQTNENLAFSMFDWVNDGFKQDNSDSCNTLVVNPRIVGRIKWSGQSIKYVEASCSGRFTDDEGQDLPFTVTAVSDTSWPLPADNASHQGGFTVTGHLPYFNDCGSWDTSCVEWDALMTCNFTAYPYYGGPIPWEGVGWSVGCH